MLSCNISILCYICKHLLSKTGSKSRLLFLQVMTTLPRPSRTTNRSGYTAEKTNTYRSGHSGTIPRNGFTIELDPSTHGDTGTQIQDI